MVETIKQLFEQNIPMSTIAKIIGTSQATVSRLCKKYKLTRDPIWTIINNNTLLKIIN